MTSFEISLVSVSVALSTTRFVDSSTLDWGACDPVEAPAPDGSVEQLGQLCDVFAPAATSAALPVAVTTFSSSVLRFS
ncbi:MAG: hypothetical protein P8M13_06280 [Luminiphilus sp.]|nr:hypothetical protein [Luminiphilus sp.]